MNGEKRKDYLEWDEYFMAIAKLSAGRSKDPSTQVGACIVSNDNRILSIGYNGAPNGFSDEKFPWGRDGKNLDTKYPYVVHAELNAILNSIGDLKGCTIYVSLFPCHECVKAIIQSGIKEVIYDCNKYDGSTAVQASMRMFDAAGVAYHQYKRSDRKIEIEL